LLDFLEFKGYANQQKLRSQEPKSNHACHKLRILTIFEANNFLEELLSFIKILVLAQNEQNSSR